VFFVFMMSLAGMLSAQVSGPAFEVASIRHNTSEPSAAAGGRGGSPIGRTGQRFTAVNATLRDIIRYAYDLEPFHPLEGSSRRLDDRFDITAIIPESPSPVDASRPMLRTLLAERFKLSIRRTTREQPVHTLLLARRDGRLGPGMKPSTVDCGASRETPRQRIAARGDTPISAEELELYVRPACDMVYQPFRARIHGEAQPIAQLARILSRLPSVRSPVVDRTGLTGAFDFELTYAPERPAASADAVPSLGDTPPTLFVALQEQLGLKLEPARAPADVLVVESVQQPTEN
jgi:uncharacterized protein (TIGR03435 family)